MNRKTSPVAAELKATDEGVARAVFVRFGGPPDGDGDIILAGAFTDGQVVPVSSYGHKSWDGELPIGKARIHVFPDRAEAEVTFFLNTTHGRDSFQVVRGLDDLCQWSWGFDVLKSSEGEWEGAPCRILEAVRLHEVSPVLLGAGRETFTVAGSVKSAAVTELARAERLLAAHPVDLGEAVRVLEERAVIAAAERLLGRAS